MEYSMAYGKSPNKLVENPQINLRKIPKQCKGIYVPVGRTWVHQLRCCRGQGNAVAVSVGWPGGLPSCPAARGRGQQLAEHQGC